EIINDVMIEGITHEKINKELKEKDIWKNIKNNFENLFDYSDFIFNKYNIEYKSEIDESIIKNKIDEIKINIKFDEKIVRTPNVLNIVLLSLGIFSTFGLAGLFIYKFKKNKYKSFNNK
ncbi:MAG: hypothetical protein ACRDCD_02715, partial [Mycoplasmoidaceae bacterium]